MTQLRVSVVLPAKDEEDCIVAVVDGIALALSGIPHEIIVVDDGSGDATADRVAAVMGDRPGLRLLRHATSCGQSAAIRSGVWAARGDIIATLDADGQNPPEELLRVLGPFLMASPDLRLGLVQGQRAKRKDTLSRRLASNAANRIRSGLLGDGVRDSACGLKAFPREVYLRLAYFDHIHRFMPAMVLREGFEVWTADVAHAPRITGRSKYGNLGRAAVGAVDLLGAAWLMRRRKVASVEEMGAAEASGGVPRRRAAERPAEETGEGAVNWPPVEAL
jgi:dolichol-phosphate mannosyltransferase